jgi:DNA primase
VVEGELDAILASELGIDAITVSTGSGSLPTLADTLLGLRVPILLLPDSDTTGHDTMQALRQALDAHKVDTTWIEFPYGGDMCGFVRDTPAEDRFDAVRKLLSD